VHFYIYPNLLKLKLMSIVEQPSDRPQLEAPLLRLTDGVIRIHGHKRNTLDILYTTCQLPLRTDSDTASQLVTLFGDLLATLPL
jgi:hypothetical protein